MSKTAKTIGWTVTVVAGLATIGDLFFKWGALRFVGAALAWLWRATTAVLTFAIPLWVLVVAGGVVAVLILAVGRRRATEDDSKPRENTPSDYCADRIFEVDWQWTWTQWGISNLMALCPRCKNELTCKETFMDNRFSSMAAGHTWGVWLDCSACGRRVAAGLENPEEAAMKEIRRRVRTGEWKEAVARLAQPIANKQN